MSPRKNWETVPTERSVFSATSWFVLCGVIVCFCSRHKSDNFSFKTYHSPKKARRLTSKSNCHIFTSLPWTGYPKVTDGSRSPAQAKARAVVRPAARANHHPSAYIRLGITRTNKKQPAQSTRAMTIIILRTRRGPATASAYSSGVMPAVYSS